MGRGKLKMELIGKEKSRNTTFQKRKNGLKQKTYEFSTLCGVDACLVVFGPNQQGDNIVEPEIWPENPEELRLIITRFKEYSKEEREKRSMDLSDFFEERRRKIEVELSKLQRQNDEYPKWDNCIDGLSEDELKNLACSLDFKLEVMNTRIHLMKEKQRLLEDSLPYKRNTMIDHTLQQQPQPLSCLKPLDQQHLPDYPHSSLIFEATPMNGFDSNLTSDSSSSSLIPYPSSMDLMAPIYYDPALTTYNEMVFNNSRAAGCYLPLHMQQPMPPYTLRSMPGASSHMHHHHHHSHVDDFSDFMDYNNKRAMF